MILPREHETPFNKAPLIRALAALLMVIAILSSMTRIVTRLVTIRTLKIDDTLIVLVAQSVAVIVQGANGLGKAHGLSESHISIILKAQYVSNALYILVLLLGKLSATRTILDMAPRGQRRLIYAAEVVVGIWAGSSIITSLFQCSLPEPWDYINGQCLNRAAFWIYVDILNFLTDLAITVFVSHMFLALKTSTNKKALVIGVFGCRIFIFPAIVCHIYYYNRAVDSPNPMFEMWPPTVIIQVILCMSVMVTCIPYLKPVMDSLDSGQMRAGDLRGTRSHGSSSRSKGGYASGQKHTTNPRGNTSKGVSSVSMLASNASNRRQNYEMLDLDADSKYAHRESDKNGTVATVCEGGRSWDGESHKSQSSQTVLVQQQIIREEADIRETIEIRQLRRLGRE